MINGAEELAFSIVQRLQGAGHVAYWAGGCVRDRLMGREPKDFDVATSARPEQVLTLFPHSQKVGIAFGVVLVHGKRGGPQVEVATFRADSEYSDGRHPDSVRFTNAQEDAKRRDFTCNGLFFDPVKQELHDFMGGKGDIEQRILRAIGDPRQRFGEDYLRMLRAIRFAAKLDFNIERETFAAIQALAPNIRRISKERIHDELALILPHATRARAAEILHTSRLLEQLWPEELFSDAQCPHRWAALKLLPPDADFILALIGLYTGCAASPEDNPVITMLSFRHSGIEAAMLLRPALLLSNIETDDFAWLLDHARRLDSWQKISKAAFKRLLADARWPRLATLFTSLRLDPQLLEDFNVRVAELQGEGVAPPPLMTGEGLIRLGAVPGREFKKWLEELYDRQLEGELRTVEEAEGAARRLMRTLGNEPIPGGAGG